MSKKRYSGSKLDTQRNDNSVQDDDQVRLKPILGIRPGVYLAFIYGAVLLLILFYFLLYPGLSKPGSLVSVKSEPSGAAVLVDGVYMEAAPCDIFISKGRHTIELRLPGFVSKSFERDFEGRVFASLVFPLRAEVSETLQARDPAGAFFDYAAEYASWTFTGEATEAYQVPLSLSEGVYRLAPGATSPAVRGSMEDTISASVRFATTRAGLRDLIRAKSLMDNNGLSPSPLSLLKTAEDAIAFLDENPQAALWLGALLQGSARSELTGSSWYAEASAIKPQAETQAAARSEYIQAGPLSFRMVNGGLLEAGGNFPPGTKVDTFYICEEVISNSVWERFLGERPEWKKENIEALIKDRLVKADYLDAPSFPGSPTGANGISWYAAKAFCEWLSTALSPQYASFEVRLPSEAEWEYAARSGAINYGNFWEWCEDPYAPLSYLGAPDLGGFLSPERSLRGGAWINPKGTVRSDTGHPFRLLSVLPLYPRGR